MPKPSPASQLSFGVNDVTYLGDLADWMDGLLTGKVCPKPGQPCVKIPVEYVRKISKILRRIGIYESEKVIRDLVDG